MPGPKSLKIANLIDFQMVPEGGHEYPPFARKFTSKLFEMRSNQDMVSCIFSKFSAEIRLIQLQQ